MQESLILVMRIPNKYNFWECTFFDNDPKCSYNVFHMTIFDAQ